MTDVASRNSLLVLLGIEIPIIQAPMAGVSTPALAAAVSNAGGLGSLGVGAMTADGARKAIRDTRSLTDKPFNVNVFCHQPGGRDPAVERAWIDWLAPHFIRHGGLPPEKLTEIYSSFVSDQAMLAVLLEERPAVVSFHFGLPSAEKIAALRSAGITLMASATNLKEADAVERAGVDVIIAQGIEAGGHRGMFDPDTHDEALSTLVLTRMIVAQSTIPVISAGGIMDGAGIVAVLALGAQGAQLGTAFAACPETSIDAGHRTALFNEASHRTVLTAILSGRPARTLVNRFTALEFAAGRPEIPRYPMAYDAGKALHAAAKNAGEAGFAAQWAGQAAPLARSLPAADLVRTLRSELAECIASLQALAY